MKIRVCDSLEVARTVINLVDLPENIARECEVSSWSNCREQGLHVNRYGTGDTDRAINVSQCRSSDSIAVFWGKRRDFDNQTNQETEEVYRNQSRYFRYDETHEAATFIANFLKGEI